METFNGRSVVLDKQPITTVYTDACNAGSGGLFGSNWFYCNWTLDWPVANGLHINYKELLAIVIAATQWGPILAGGKRLYIISDNQVAVWLGCSTGGQLDTRSLCMLCAGSFGFRQPTAFT